MTTLEGLGGPMGEFDGMVAAVTGGGSGIGAACVAALRDAGAQVGVLDLHPHATAGDSGVLALECDLRDEQAVRASVNALTDRLGWLDILVNCAGVGVAGTVEDGGDDEWTRVLDTNVVALARVCRTALPRLRHSEHAAIVNVASVATFAGVAGQALYAASAGAVHALTLAMAADLVSQGVRVNCVCPGMVDTPWLTGMLARSGDPDAERERLRSRQPTGRLVTPEEVAVAVCALADPRAGSTGTTVPVDGGLHTLLAPPRV